MLFELDALKLLAILLVALRLGVVFYLTPFDALGRIPKRFSVLMVLALSAVLVSSLGVQIDSSSTTIVDIGIFALSELTNGLALVVGVYVAFASVMVAGQLIDAQTGFAAAAVLNPATNTQDPLMGLLMQLFIGVLFFAMGMHHIFIEGLVESFRLVPVGSRIEIDRFGDVFATFGMMFTFGVVLAAPVIVGILMLDVGIAMMSRTMPQMNIYFVTLPLKIFVGLVLLALSIRYSIPLIETLLREIFFYWARILN